MPTLTGIKCGHCPGRHQTAGQVLDCSRGRNGRGQFNTVRNSMQPQDQPVVRSTPRPPQINDQLTNMLLATKDGRYAVRLDTNEPYKFLRLSRPTKGRSKDFLKIQSQHSDMLAIVAMIHVSGRASSRYLHDARYLPALRLLVCDPVTAMIEYGRRKGKCGRCGKTLTDDRSRFYAIGPECEKFRPDVLRRIESLFGGPYPGPGWEQ